MAQEQQAIVWDVATVFILSGSVWCGFSSVEPFRRWMHTLAHFHPRVARPLYMAWEAAAWSDDDLSLLPDLIIRIDRLLTTLICVLIRLHSFAGSSAV